LKSFKILQKTGCYTYQLVVQIERGTWDPSGWRCVGWL
jgi:hypothetical protein